MLDSIQRLFMVSFFFSLIFFLLWLIHQKKLKENYGFLWFCVGVVYLAIILWFRPVIFLSRLFHIQSPANFLFFVFLFFILAVCIHFSVLFSKMSTQIKNLAQAIALLEKDRRPSAPGKDQ